MWPSSGNVRIFDACSEGLSRLVTVQAGKLLPAPAGMDPPPAPTRERSPPAPRACGDGPHTQFPLAWGGLRQLTAWNASDALSPAGADRRANFIERQARWCDRGGGVAEALAQHEAEGPQRCETPMRSPSGSPAGPGEVPDHCREGAKTSGSDPGGRVGAPLWPGLTCRARSGESGECRAATGLWALRPAMHNGESNDHESREEWRWQYCVESALSAGAEADLLRHHALPPAR